MIFYYTDAFERVTPDIRGHIDGLGRDSIHFKNIAKIIMKISQKSCQMFYHY